MKINLQKNKGFVMLFAVTLSAILLSIALGVANIAFKEVRFSTNARDTNDAFFAADTGAEYVLFEDLKNNSYNYGLISGDRSGKSWFILPIIGLGSTGAGCAVVTINKSTQVDGGGNEYIQTTIISKGYNIGDSFTCTLINPNRVEREIKVTY